jgi:transposase-like protein
MVVRPKCDSEDYVRDGIVKGQQRHRCKGCGYRAYRVTLRKKALRSNLKHWRSIWKG